MRVGETSFTTWEMKVKTGLWPNSWKDWWLCHATNASYQLIKRVAGGAGEKCFLQQLRTQEVNSQITLTEPAHIHTHRNMQVMHPAAVALIPWVSSSAALSHPSTLSFTSHEHSPGVAGTPHCKWTPLQRCWNDTTNGRLNCALEPLLQ